MKALDKYSCSVRGIELENRKEYAKQFLKKVLGFYDGSETVDDYEIVIDNNLRAHFTKKK